MTARIRAQIRRQALPVQIIAWPAYGLLYALCGLVSWATREMAGQAKTKAKKTLSPFLWPAFALLAVVLLCEIIGEQQVVGLANAMLGPLIIVLMFVFWFKMIRRPKKKKK